MILTVEVNNVFDRTEIAGVVFAGGCILGVIQGELVLTDSCNCCADIEAGALEPLVTIDVSVFLATERLDAARVEALDHRFEEYCFEILLGDTLDKRGER
jgi:hypothetical protein